MVHFILYKFSDFQDFLSKYCDQRLTVFWYWYYVTFIPFATFNSLSVK